MPKSEIESPNPYAPTTEELNLPESVSKPDRFGLPLLWLLPGSVAGLNIGVAVVEGIAPTINRTTRHPWDAAIFFLGFGISCAVISLMWRIPRRFVIGHHQLWWLGCFVSGFVMAGVFAAGMSIASLLPWNVSYPTEVVLNFLWGAFATVLSVEIEVLMSKRGRFREAGPSVLDAS